MSNLGLKVGVREVSCTVLAEEVSACGRPLNALETSRFNQEIASGIKSKDCRATYTLLAVQKRVTHRGNWVGI